MKKRKIFIPFLVVVMAVPLSLSIISQKEFTTNRINYSAGNGFTDDNLYTCITSDDEYSQGLSAITKLECIDKGVESLEGIGQLTNLEELNVGQNNITTADLSGNTKLRWLEAAHNQITSVKLPDSIQEVSLNDNKLSGTLDLRDKTNLIKLAVKKNELTELNVTGIKTLTDLEISENDLTTLIVSKTSLAYLSVSDMTNLKKLYVSSMPNLQSLNVANNTNLEDIDTSFSLFENNIDLSGLTKLKKITASYDKIKTIDFSAYQDLEKVVTTKYDNITVSGTSITTQKLLEYVPSTINTTSGYKWYMNKIDDATSYTKDFFSGNVGTESLPVLVIKGANSEVNGFSGTQEFHEYFRLTFTKDAGTTINTETTPNPKTGIKEVGIISVILISIISVISYIKLRKNRLFKNL